MIGCSENCIKRACCDLCIYVIHDEFIAEDTLLRVLCDPIGCSLHEDARHQDIAQSNSACNDFYCINAQKPERWVEIDVCDT